MVIRAVAWHAFGAIRREPVAWRVLDAANVQTHRLSDTVTCVRSNPTTRAFVGCPVERARGIR